MTTAAITASGCSDADLPAAVSQRNHPQDAAAGYLVKSADSSSQVSHFDPGSTDPSTDTSAPVSASAQIKHATSSHYSHSRSHSHSRSRAGSTASTPYTAPPIPPIPPDTPTLPPSALRKTSPGLAARLKALGFGASKQPARPTTPQHDHIGRLNEEQIRQLDEKHQAGSINSIIQRRGRPWKGPSATSSPKSTGDSDLALLIDSSPPPAPRLLPEIKSSGPLEMDTQKYRLPDHTNGNGTKVTLETRREHLERSTRLPSPTDVESPPPPPPPPKDNPPSINNSKQLPALETPSSAAPPVHDYVADLDSYFTPGHNRPGSIYTLSRASFANQLAQLTSLQLPDAESLSSRVSAIPTAQVAAKALINAADQIRSWISKAAEVIEGLDSDDDVEWAAAGGREGLDEVESAITRFEELINFYVGAIEELQGRQDISNVPLEDLNRAVSQMESIIDEWSRIRRKLQVVKSQVEIAMEWEELWNSVLGDIQSEMDELSRLVFEMEERRHKSLMAAAHGDGVDIGDLETIVEENPAQGARLQAHSRFSLPAFPASPGSPGTPNLSQDDSSLLALFARMQPLRASLDFLPMRLSVFENRAQQTFPTACEELEMRRSGLDASYKKLEKDAESLRKELGEDRWVIVFRGAGRQAQKMHESVERSLLKLKEAVEAGLHLTSQPTMIKKIESYEAKKMHYGGAIERVLSIIDKGVKDRLTVNGEILRLHNEMQSRWRSLKDQMREMDVMLEETQVDRRTQQLRDSVSSMLSNDVSTTGSGRETPVSSPPSSIIMSGLGIETNPQTPKSKMSRTRSSSTNPSNTTQPNRRYSSLPTPAKQVTKKPSTYRLSTVASQSASTPVPPSKITRPSSTLGHRPRWTVSTNTAHVDTGHNFKPLNLTTPSPYAKSPLPPRSASAVPTSPGGGSRLPFLRSPGGRASTESPQPHDTPSRGGHSRLSFRERISSPNPYAQRALSRPPLTSQNSAADIGNRRSSYQPPTRPTLNPGEGQPSRPASSLASSSRRASLLPQPRARRESSSTGRASPQALAGARSAMRQSMIIEPKDYKPRWRH